MTHIRVKGFKIYQDRHGRTRCYHRATGRAIDLEKHPLGSAEFIAICAQITASTTVATPSVGTLSGLIADYKKNSAFTNLAPRTRCDYEKHFSYLKPMQDIPLASFSRAAIIQIRDKAETKKGWHYANYLTRTLSVLFSWAKDRDLIDDNPAAGIKPIPRPKDQARANRPWTDAECEAFLSAAHWKIKVGMAIMLYTALRPADALSLPKSAYDGQFIRHRTGKTGQEVVIYALAPLRRIIAEAPPHLATTIAASTLGQPWNKDGFRMEFMRLREKLEKEGKIGTGLTLYGLRHTAATMLTEEGFDTKTVADYLGQATEKMARHYSRDANLTRKMKTVGEKMDEALQNRAEKCLTFPKKCLT